MFEKKHDVIVPAYIKIDSRSYDADTAFSLWISQALHTSGALIEGGEPGAQVSRIPAVYRRQHTHTVSQWPYKIHIYQ